jgi:TRAP-type C4-dicarboxylate transport system permease small subunit
MNIECDKPNAYLLDHKVNILNVVPLGMLTEKEKAFLLHWEKVRDMESGFVRKLLSGLPMAMLFGFPILLLILGVQSMMPEWSTKISKSSGGTYLFVFVAVLGVICFYAFFRKHYQWEMNEQLYKELRLKQNRADKPDTTE